MGKLNKAKIVRGILFFAICFLGFVTRVQAQVKVIENKNFTFNIIPYFRTDLVTLKNNIYLDSKNSDDSSTYLGIDYSLGFDLQFKGSGPHAYLKLERNGPYDYDAPVFIHIP